MQPAIEIAPIGVDEFDVAKAIDMSVHFLRKDRRTKRLIPFYRIGDSIRYNLDRVREALSALEEGGAHIRKGANARKSALVVGGK